jgi:hypothetical protein
VENGFDTQAGTGADRTTTHQHTVSGTTDAGGSHSHTVTVDSASDHTHSLGSGSTGSGNMPYLVVNFIVYVGV